MAIELRWLVSQSACCLHTADLLRRRHPLADGRLGDALQEPTQGLISEIDYGALPEERFWQALIAISINVEDNRQLAEIALRKTVGRERVESLVTPLAGRITELEKAAQTAFPDLVDRVAARADALRHGWSLFGAQVLNQIGVETDPALLADRADVALLWPSAGGAGAAHLQSNSVRIEAVDDDPDAEFPEWLRLAWLLSQLNLDLPIHSEMIHRDRLSPVAGLAMLPVALNAAAALALQVPWELPVDATWIGRAIEAWQVVPEATPGLTETVGDWWYSYYESHPRWSVALNALDRMLLEAEAAGRAHV
jgi:hypothetical protein